MAAWLPPNPLKCVFCAHCDRKTFTLVSPDLSLKLAAAVESMPAFPRSVKRILALTRDVNCSPKDLVRVIDKDPVITVKVLRVVNSAYYSLAKQITSIDHAVVFLGFNTIKNLALSIAAIGMLPATPEAGFDGQQYLLHSLATAGIAKQLGQRLADADPHDCFIAGLLHDFGKVVIAQFMPQEFRKAREASLWHETSLHQALRDVIGVDHAAIGAMLAEKWRFAPNLIETIAHQHEPDLLDTGMVASVFAANQISQQLGFDFGGSPVPAPLPPQIAQRLGGTLEEVMTSLGDLTPLLDEAHRFARI